MNSARVRPSRRCWVGLQSAVGSRLVSAIGSRLGRAVGRGAGRSGRAVRLRGFASPNVLIYCLAVFGIPVANYSDSSPQASGQLGKVRRRFFFWRVFAKMIMQKTKLVHADISNECFKHCKFYAEGADSVSSEPPSISFMFPPLFGLCSRLPDSRSAVCG